MVIPDYTVTFETKEEVTATLRVSKDNLNALLQILCYNDITQFEAKLEKPTYLN